MSSKLKKALQFLLFLGIGVVILGLVYRSQNTAFQEQCRLDGVPAGECSLIDQLLYDFSTVHPGWILLVIAAFTASNMLRAWRWQMLLEPMGYRARFVNSFLTILLGYFANLFLPRMGEVVRAGSLSRYERIPMERVMGTLVVDRLMDFVCLALVVGLTFIFEADTLWAFISSNQQENGSSPALWQYPVVQIGLALFLLAAIVAVLFRKKILQHPFVQKVSNLIEGFWDGLRSVFRLRHAGLFIAYSLGIWLMFYLQCWFNLLAFPPTAHLGPGAALMIFVFGTLGFVIPAPGGMGSFHALVIAGLALYGVIGSNAFSYAMIAFFTIQIFYNFVAGMLSLVLLPLLNKRQEANTSAATEHPAG
ncbi:MAG: flippase-like domain-containing protein [Bacteroidetes bacterium]|nr:MAG: flippase-like domain-containing protein [Bacteroidota bacterium]